MWDVKPMQRLPQLRLGPVHLLQHHDSATTQVLRQKVKFMFSNSACTPIVVKKGARVPSPHRQRCRGCSRRPPARESIIK